MDLKDIVFSSRTYDLLKENGRLDQLAGIDRDAGWADVCAKAGYDPNRRTPAREAYEDGWYTPKEQG